jgi:hypothetical protein
MRETVARVAGHLPGTFELEEIDISADPALEALHGLEIPVLMINGRKAAKYRVDGTSLARMLRTSLNSAGGGER